MESIKDMNKKLREKANEIYQAFIHKKLSKVNAFNQLVSIIDEATEIDLILESIKLLQGLKFLDPECFTYFEDLFVSNLNYQIRCAACFSLFNLFKERCIKLLLWGIENEKDYRVFEEIVNSLIAFTGKLERGEFDDLGLEKEDITSFQRIDKNLKTKYDVELTHAIILLLLEKICLTDNIVVETDARKVITIDLSLYSVRVLPKVIKEIKTLKFIKVSIPNLLQFKESDLEIYYGLKSEQFNFIKDLIREIKVSIPRAEFIDNSAFGVKIEGDTIENKEIAELGLYYKHPHIGHFHTLNGRTVSYTGGLLERNRMKLKNIPKSIGILKSLKILYLNNNEIKYLPDAIYKLPSLHTLDVSDNELETIHESINNMDSLTSFIIDYPQAKKLEKGMLKYYYGLKPEQYSIIEGINCSLNEPIPKLEKDFEDGRRGEEKFGVIVDNQNTHGNKDVIKLGLNLPVERSVPFIGNHPSQNHESDRKTLKSLPEDITKLESLKELHLKGNKIEQIPDTITRLTNLEALDLAHNKLIMLPNAIGDLKRLKTLNLKKNNLIILPESIGNLTEVKELDLEKHNLKTLPISIGKMNSLEILNLSENDLTYLPEEIGNLKLLKRLYLYQNKLTQIPKSIENLSNLIELDITHNKTLKEIPETIGDLQSLEILDLFENKIESLPDSICNLRNLKQLKLWGNKITNLPECIGNLEQLELLKLGGNQLTHFPDSIGRLKKLKELTVGGNNITSIPKSMGNLKSLRELILTGNPIAIVSDELFTLENLRNLYLNNTNLEIIPETIGNLKLLEKLELHDNNLKEIPETIGNLKNLTDLSLNNNRLEILPNSIGDLESLFKRSSAILDLSNNELSNLPETLKNLDITAISLSNNRFIHFPEVLYNHYERLRTLRLDGNNLSSLPELLGNFGKLQTLDLRNNKLTTLPSSLKNLELLEKFFISGNPLYDNPDMETISFLKGLNRNIFIQNPNLIFIIAKENPVDYILRITDQASEYQKAKILCDMGYRIIKEGTTSEIGFQLIDKALEMPNFPESVMYYLPRIYREKGELIRLIKLNEKAIENWGYKPDYVTDLLNTASITGRRDILNKYVDLSLKHEEVLNNPYSFSNVILGLNVRNDKKASEISIKLTRDYWKKGKKMITTLWSNMTDTYIVADVVDEVLEEMVNEIVKRQDEMHPITLENIAWYFMKIGQTDDAIHYLKEAKKKNHPNFKGIKDLECFKDIRDNEDFSNLFD